MLRVLRHQTADRDIDLITTVESSQDGCARTTDTCVARGVFLLDGRRSNQGHVIWLREVVPGRQPDVGAVESGFWSPGIVVEPGHNMSLTSTPALEGFRKNVGAYLETHDATAASNIA